MFEQQAWKTKWHEWRTGRPSSLSFPPSRRVRFAPRADIRPMPAFMSTRPRQRTQGRTQDRANLSRSPPERLATKKSARSPPTPPRGIRRADHTQEFPRQKKSATPMIRGLARASIRSGFSAVNLPPGIDLERSPKRPARRRSDPIRAPARGSRRTADAAGRLPIVFPIASNTR
jgi:hypothetical protein